MAKTEETTNLEEMIMDHTLKLGVFGCLEVTIGFGGNERVDYMTMDTKGIFRCYEIKVSKSDFNSNAKHSFVGNFNYYVMPIELYEEVKNEIPKEIGVYTYGRVVKKPKCVNLKVDKSILKDSLIRSMYRDASKIRKSESAHIMQNMERKINNLTRDKQNLIDENSKLRNEIYYLKHPTEAIE